MLHLSVWVTAKARSRLGRGHIMSQHNRARLQHPQ